MRQRHNKKRNTRTRTKNGKNANANYKAQTHETIYIYILTGRHNNKQQTNFKHTSKYIKQRSRNTKPNTNHILRISSKIQSKIQREC